MNRLQKKCFIGSAGVHLLLFVILFIGPAFLSSKEKPHLIDPQTLDFYPSKLIDEAFSGGGNRNAKPPPAVEPAPQPPSQPQPQSHTEKMVIPDPPKETVKIPKIDPDAVDPKPEPKRHRPQISTTPVPRIPDESKTSKKKPSISDTKAQEQQRENERRQLSQQFARAAASIGENTSKATTIDYGLGRGGESYASYDAFVKWTYETAWQAPDDTATDDAVTKVTVTVANDGTVLSRSISRPSGDPKVDSSVQRTINKVTFIRPFPEGSKDKQRTFIINFNLKAKRGLA